MKKLISYILIGTALLGMTSCKDFLEKAPVLSQSTDLVLSSYDGLNKAVIGSYAYLASSGWYAGERVLESEMRSGNGIKAAAHNSNRYSTQMNWNYSPDATSGFWSTGYVTISRCNNVIDNLEGKDVGGITAKDLDNLRAEALFLRALAHFDMVTLYALPYTYVKANQASLKPAQKLGVPYVKHTDPAGKPERDAVLDVYQYIVDDLLDAERAIDPAYVRAGVKDKKAVVTLPVIQALLSRVYLYMGEWQKAADYATKVISNNNYALYEADEYADVWTNDIGGSEVIFENYIDMDHLSNTACSYMTFPDGSYGDCIASQALYNLYEDGDVRKELFRQDKDETPGLWWTLKYEGKGIYVPDASNTAILRLSEMYLNRAEALVHGATVAGTTALDDLNAITSRRGATAYTNAGMQAIKLERRKELAWEGHYFFDLARWGDSVTREACYNLQADNQNIPFPDHRWALPLPKGELEVNENLVQNDEY